MPETAPAPPAGSLRVGGTVTWFCADRGFGFVAPEDGGDDVFVSWSSLPGRGFRALEAGQPVTFILDRDQHGPVAHRVEPVV
jgi:cold shock protein